jgi:hypothetical protein
VIKHKDYEGYPISLTAKELNRSSDGWVVISRPHKDGLMIAAVSLETGMPWGGKIKIAQTAGDIEIARQDALRDLSKMGLGGRMADSGRFRKQRKAAARSNPAPKTIGNEKWTLLGEYVLYGDEKWTVDNVYGYPTKTVDLRRTIIVDPKRRYLDRAEFRRGVSVKAIEVWSDAEHGPRPNPAPKNIDHKFAGSLFSVDPTLAMGYLRGSMSKGTARDLAKAKLAKAKAKRRSNPAALDRCVESVQRRGGAVNAWAVCTASLKRTGRLSKRRSNPDWAALSAKAREKAKAAYAKAKPHAARGLAATKAGAARAGAAVKRGTKKAAPHVARGFRSLSERLDRFAVSNPRIRTRR